MRSEGEYDERMKLVLEKDVAVDGDEERDRRRWMGEGEERKEGGKRTGLLPADLGV